jgi:2-polyprenyl-6-hydroxyphenyl methylase/3-demethylubiquinone-9 3-methyltransferase
MSGASQVIGMDINQRCIDVSAENFKRFGSASVPAPEFLLGSVLDVDFLTERGHFDVVYAWGSLHHTGQMWKAIENAAARVRRPGGKLILALYNRHWSCPGWLLIKRVYNVSPRFIQALMNYAFGAVIYLAKLLVTRQNPMKKERGMDFWFDIIDWLGGYPFEYASETEVVDFMKKFGFALAKSVPPTVPTGCNEFIFDAEGAP